MKFNLSLLTYTVHANYMSIKAVINGPPEGAVNALQELKGKKKKAWLDNVSVISKVESINVTKRISVTIHIEKERYAEIRLYELSEQKTPFNFYIKNSVEEKLQSLLKQISTITGQTQEDILEQVSSFTCKDGKIVRGKRSIHELTVPWQKTVEGKLSNILKEQAVTA